MLISREHKFIFIHLYKNAGTSVTSALMPYAASGRVIFLSRMLRKLGIVTRYDPQPFAIHITASELVSQMGREEFESYFSFAIVRNPWDWQVSVYNYTLKEVNHHQRETVKKCRAFDEYIEWRCSRPTTCQKDYICDQSGAQLVDFVARYENLDADFQFICSRLGISAVLPKLNVTKIKPYQEYYSERSVALVREKFAPDIALFDYEFGA